MGGATRNQRKRRQDAAKVVAAARRTSGDRTKMTIGVAVVAVLGVAVIGGILFQHAQANKQAQSSIPPVVASANYPVRLEGGVVVAGKDTAKVTVDGYEDFLCPACGKFEARDAKQVEKALSNGTLRMRYHVINMLDNNSNPPGYALQAANAALCTVSYGKFTSFHDSLYAKQPSENSAGYTNDQLIRLGNALGVTASDFTGCVQSGRYNTQVQSDLNQAIKDPALQREVGGGRKTFATPTIVSGGTLVDVSDPQWLSKLLQQSGAQIS